jgi:glutamyl-tRNA synthetase
MALLPEGPYGDDSWKSWTTAVKEATGRKGRGLFMPLRKAVTGKERGPDMSALLALMTVVQARG